MVIKSAIKFQKAKSILSLFDQVKYISPKTNTGFYLAPYGFSLIKVKINYFFRKY